MDFSRAKARAAVLLLAGLLCCAAAGCGAGEEAPPATPPASSSAPREELGSAPPETAGDAPEEGPLTETERLGDLRIGQSQEEVARLLGEPLEQTEPEYWAADGLNHSRWTYDGVTLSFAEDTLESVAVTAPFPGGTDAGIKIGSSAEKVREAYGAWIDRELSTREQIIAGTPYGGLFFTMEEGAVTKIVLGAGAE